MVVIHKNTFWYALPAKKYSGFWNSVIRLLCWVKLNMYRFESGSCLPFIIIYPFPLLRMSTFLSSKIAWHTWSPIIPIDSKALLRPGKRCAFRASIIIIDYFYVWHADGKCNDCYFLMVTCRVKGQIISCYPCVYHCQSMHFIYMFRIIINVINIIFINISYITI